MRVIKIGAIWCGGCLIMNKVWNKLKKSYEFEYEEFDLDMDSDAVQRFNPGDKLPVFIILDGNSEVDIQIAKSKTLGNIKITKSLRQYNKKNEK